MSATGTTTVLCTWEAEGTNVGEVLAALDHLRRSSERTATRTAVVTLVIVVADDAERERARWALHSLGGPSPGRTIIITPAPDGPPGCDARITLHGAEAAGHQVWSEDVELRVGGGGATHLDSLISPLTFADLPVVAWWVGAIPGRADRLVRAADAVLVDTQEAPEPASLQAAAALLPVRPVIDLSWLRTTPWRELLAGLFDGPDWQPFLRRIRSAEVSGREGIRQLLAGWLRSRLDLGSADMRLHDAPHVSMALVGEHAGRSARFVVERLADGRLLRAGAAVDGGPSASEVFGIPDVTLPWSLGQALTHLHRDLVYEASLRATVGEDS